MDRKWSEIEQRWATSLAKGWLTGKPFAKKTVSHYQQGLRRYWQWLNCKPSISRLLFEDIREALSVLEPDFDKGKNYFAVKEQTYKAVRPLYLFLVAEGPEINLRQTNFST